MSAELEVPLGERGYRVRIGQGLLADPDPLRAAIRGRQVLLLSNTTVAPLYAARVETALTGMQLRTVLLEDGERHKTVESAARIWQALAELGAQRNATLLALGGGVIGDLGGFAAACWMRGIDFIQLPTTLLAMVDSSVGGKTGVNLPQGKNLVGAFWQPRLVLADIDTLATLPAREYRAGLAEVVKYGAIFDAAFFDWLERHADALSARAPETLAQAVLRSCRHKTAVVVRDERENGERALLNFGHTFGHALETLGDYSLLLHGEAVAIGMCMAAQLSAELGLAPTADGARLRELLRALGLPTTRPSPVAPRRMVELMRLDKKTLSDRLRLILWRGIGRAEIFDGIDAEAVVASLADDAID
ncbi:MAG: 3-dehydroquinate synthase [Xanthomonadales bacterium PRO6]|nr:3-dehydroquinate synthase [Xanthomonadales bacterium]MCE7930571.1 3-dehydroquinate synthase [Xanthomonadales bacterium PRO6]